MAVEPGDIYTCEIKGCVTRNHETLDHMKSKKKPSNKQANKLAPSRKYVNKIVDWCVKTYGKSKYNRYFPEIKYRKGEYMTEDPRVMAFYDSEDDVIFINKNDHNTVYQLASTIIHEYTHYKQNQTHYDVLSRYLPYHKNPMEIEANKIARRDARKCVKEIMQKKSSK